MTLENSNRASGAAIGFVIAVVLFVALALVVKVSVSTPNLDEDHGAARSQALAEIRATEDKSLTTAGWVDQSRGIVRLPIETAIQHAATESATEIRNELKDRAEKAAAPAPVAPAKPSVFE